MGSILEHPTIKGQATALRVEKILHHEKTKYQDILLFKSTSYGNVLVLDNVIQATERDEFSYQEMITHLAMNAHLNPTSVLVIGGGDGGVLREVVKHDCAEKVILCDIDEAVIRVSKQYLPSMSTGFNNAKCSVQIEDGFQFIDQHKDAFDVIITDSCDQEGPSKCFFGKQYFTLLFDALREGGVGIIQGFENHWLDLSFVASLKKDCESVFPVVEYAHGAAPTYPSGQMAFIICCKDPKRDIKVPTRRWTKTEEALRPAPTQKVSHLRPAKARAALRYDLYGVAMITATTQPAADPTAAKTALHQRQVVAAARRRYGCYNSTRIDLAVQAGDEGLHLMPNPFIIDTLNNSVVELPAEGWKKLDRCLMRSSPPGSPQKQKSRFRFWNRI
ncbi:Spermidine synthase [Hirsutella minnesotensis 3608]|uniref:Spermidine synthase n=1 Tax=Hirsutella minnesotensis 3608 TaxID=1043627 RepID=A0A0F7ZS65_9HYPO|nr:Spermidine synthase [Hirsutella minnesotensis 3608]